MRPESSTESPEKETMTTGYQMEEQLDVSGLPLSMIEPTLVAYRSAGIGLFGVVMRYSGMPLEKIALFMNSSQVSGSNQLSQSWRLTFREGLLAPYRVVGPASVVAWFLQYSVMGLAFQTVDHSLSRLFNVKPVYYGSELMEPAEKKAYSFDYQMKSGVKTILSPIFAAAFESFVSNRAEVQRYYGHELFGKVEAKLNFGALARMRGPAFLPNTLRNVIMCQTTFLLTPITYKLYFPQELKTKQTLFWYGLTLNIFVGNVVAITQQAFWGRTLDYAAKHGKVDYTNVIREGFGKEGVAAFFTVPKWFSRVLMNAPAQGVLPWFYNEVLPLGEPAVLAAVKMILYEPLLKKHLQALEARPMSSTSAEPLTRHT